MNIFYAPDAQLNGLCFLDETESHHAVHVLRMQKGNGIAIFDGKGSLYEGSIVEAGKKQVAVQILSLSKHQEKTNNLHIAIAPTKQMERFEWFIEKAVEIGVNEISPLLCTRSERKEIKKDRLEKLIISACKQSKQYHLPKLNEMQKFQDFIKRDLPENRCVAWCETHAKSIASLTLRSNPLVCMIGPEGDFTEDEIKSAQINSFQPVTLGNSILRTETAGVFAAAAYAIAQVK